MKLKNWVLIFLIAMVITGSTVGLFNIAVDPFGVFGDKLLNWYAYDMTNNPRVAKIGYLDQNHEAYDSYIIGCSKTSSFSTEKLNQYFDGAAFYNMIMYGGDLYDIEKTAFYMINHYKVKNLVVNIGLEEATNYQIKKDPMKNALHAKVDDSSLIKFYGRYAFANPEYAFSKLKEYFNRSSLPNQYRVFVPETGVYNKAIRDTESIVNIDDYIKRNPAFLEDLWQENMDVMDEAVGAIDRIKAYCEEKGITFMLITSPVYQKELQMYSEEDLKTFWQKLANVTPFWDFSGYSIISYEPRYFYDSKHFRNSVGDMALGYIFDDPNVYRPEGFGHLTTAENVVQHSELIFGGEKVAPIANTYSVEVPILTYHQLDSDEAKGGGSTVTPDQFKSNMEAVKAAGYQTIFFKDLVNYVERGEALPDKPIVITFDDGYTSNYEYAFKILKELGMKATISVIGRAVGEDTYKDTGFKTIPHFDFEEAQEMYSSGVMDIQSHSFDMHDSKDLEADARIGILQKEEEVEADYIEAFRQDYLKSKKDVEEQVGNDVFVFTYPLGKYSNLSEALLRELGNKISLTTEPGVNTVVKGLPQSLNGLKRINVASGLSGEEIIETIESYIK